VGSINCSEHIGVCTSSTFLPGAFVLFFCVVRYKLTDSIVCSGAYAGSPGGVVYHIFQLL